MWKNVFYFEKITKEELWMAHSCLMSSPYESLKKKILTKQEK